ALAACTPPPPAQVLVVDPGEVYSGTIVELDVALVRASQLTGTVELGLTSTEPGITAAPVSTATDSGTLLLEVDAAAAPGNYDVTVVAKDADSTATSQPLSLVVLGPQPGSISGEVRSLMIPSPLDGGFPAVMRGDVSTKSFVPGEDVPLAFDATRLVPGEIVISFESDAALGALAAGGGLSVDGVTLSPSEPALI